MTIAVDGRQDSRRIEDHVCWMQVLLRGGQAGRQGPEPGVVGNVFEIPSTPADLKNQCVLRNKHLARCKMTRNCREGSTHDLQESRHRPESPAPRTCRRVCHCVTHRELVLQLFLILSLSKHVIDKCQHGKTFVFYRHTPVVVIITQLIGHTCSNDDRVHDKSYAERACGVAPAIGPDANRNPRRRLALRFLPGAA